MVPLSFVIEYTIGVSWRFKLPLLLVLFAAAPLGVTVFWAIDLLQATNEKSTTDGLQALASARAEAIEQFTSDRHSEVERIAQLLATEVQDLERGRSQLEALQNTPTEPPANLEDAEKLAVRKEDEPQDARGDEPQNEQENEAERGEANRNASPNTAQEPPVKPYLIVPTRNVEDQLKALRQKLGLILWDQQKFEELLIMATDGHVLVSTFSEHEGKTATEIAYFQNGLGVTYTQPVFLSPITNRLTMVISTPIRDEHAEVKGVLAARLNLSRFFRLINDTTGLQETGETVVGKLMDDSIVMMAPTRLDPDAALKRRIPKGSPEGRALQLASAGESGAGQVRDYQGKCAYAAWKHVAILEWALVVKIHCDEARAPVVKIRDRAIVWTLAIAALALIAAIFVARALVMPLRALKRATDRMSKGDFDVSLDIRSGDEVGALAESFERMVVAVKYFREQSREREEDLTDQDGPSDGSPSDNLDSAPTKLESSDGNPNT